MFYKQCRRYIKYQLKGPALPGGNFFFRICFSLRHPPVTPECPQQISAQSVQPFGRLQGTYIRMSCFIIWTSLSARFCTWNKKDIFEFFFAFYFLAEVPSGARELKDSLKKIQPMWFRSLASCSYARSEVYFICRFT